MSPQEPAPTPDDKTVLLGIVAQAMYEYRIGDGSHPLEYGGAAGAVLDALKSAGYELVNQVGTYWPPTIMEPEEFDTLKAELDAEDAANLVELTARWIGERESTHLWPEIREDDKACYRDAARHLLATIRHSDCCPRS